MANESQIEINVMDQRLQGNAAVEVLSAQGSKPLELCRPAGDVVRVCESYLLFIMHSLMRRNMTRS